MGSLPAPASSISRARVTAAPLRPATGSKPHRQAAPKLRAITKNQRGLDSAVMMSSLMPSEKYSCSGSPLMLMAGRSGSGKTGRDGSWGSSVSGLMACAGSASSGCVRTTPMKRMPLRAMVRISFWFPRLSPTLRSSLLTTRSRRLCHRAAPRDRRSRAAQDHPPLRDRVVRIVSRAQLEAICPGTYSCAIPRPPDTCLVFLPAQVPAQWPTRAATLRHEFRHCAGRGQD
jgi:hypothetical protein